MLTAHTQILIGHSLELVDYSQTSENLMGLNRTMISRRLREIFGEWLWPFIEHHFRLAAEHGKSQGIFASKFSASGDTVAGCAVVRSFTSNPIVRFTLSITHIDARFIDLTPREMELLFLMGGNDVKQVAKAAGITPKTTYAHLRSIGSKLSLDAHGVRNLAVTLHNTLEGDLDRLKEFSALRPHYQLSR